METQEQYYNDILSRCLYLQTLKGQDSSLDGSFEALSLHEEAVPTHKSSQERLALDSLHHRTAEESKDVSVIVQAMRKLREAIVASHRTDAFAQSVYIFIIRATILVGHMESYHPALLHLLNRIHTKTPLSANILQEMLGYHILDLACRQQDLNTAYRVRYSHTVHDLKIDGLLHATTHGNWFAFRKVEGSMDRYQRCLVQAIQIRMRKHALDCMGRSYLSVERNYIEEATHMPWDELRKGHRVSWPVEDSIVIIRQVKRKP